jgi:hypothetical protein
MITEQDAINYTEEWKNKDNTLAEFIATIFKDKFVEIYVGDSYEDVKFEQTSQNYPAVFCGKIIAAYKECLVLEAIYVSKDRSVKTGSLLFLNERAIRCLSEVNAEYAIQDMMLRSNETSSIYSAYRNNKQFKVKK